MFEGVEGSRGLHHFVVDKMGQMIASGELAEDTQIMPEEIGEQFGVSRTVVREVLRVLESKGMVRPRPKTGTRVLPVTQWNLLDQEVIGWRVQGPESARQLSELSDLRAAVEIFAARRCADNATPEQVAALHHACDEMEATGLSGDLSGFTAADITFHTLILEASGNAVFGNFAAPFAAFLHAREELHTLPEQVENTVLEDHRQIVVAIEKHQPDLAESLSRDLIEKARQELQQKLAKRRGK